MTLYIKVALGVALAAGAVAFVLKFIESFNLWRGVISPMRRLMSESFQRALYAALDVFAATGLTGAFMCAVVFVFFYL